MARHCGACGEPIDAHGQQDLDGPELARIASTARSGSEALSLRAAARRVCPVVWTGAGWSPRRRQRAGVG